MYVLCLSFCIKISNYFYMEAYITNAWSWFVVKIGKYIQIHFVHCNISLFAIAADFISLRYESFTILQNSC